MAITPISELRAQLIQEQEKFTALFDTAKDAVQSGNGSSAKIDELKKTARKIDELFQEMQTRSHELRYPDQQILAEAQFLGLRLTYQDQLTSLIKIIQGEGTEEDQATAGLLNPHAL